MGCPWRALGDRTGGEGRGSSIEDIICMIGKVRVFVAPTHLEKHPDLHIFCHEKLSKRVRWMRGKFYDQSQLGKLTGGCSEDPLTPRLPFSQCESVERSDIPNVDIAHKACESLVARFPRKSQCTRQESETASSLILGGRLNECPGGKSRSGRSRQGDIRGGTMAVFI